MIVELFILPEVVLLGWFFLNKRSATKMVAAHGTENAMLQHLRDYLHQGYEVESRQQLLSLTEEASRGAFDCKRQSFFLPHRGGKWTLGGERLDAKESSLLSRVVAEGHSIDRRGDNSSMCHELLEDSFSMMDHYGINVLVPVSDSTEAQWVWASYFGDRNTTPAVDALSAWQMAMQSVVERTALRQASAHLADLERDAASATEVLRVLLPDAPADAKEGLEWAGALQRDNGELPVLFAAYPRGDGKLLVVFAEVVAPGLAAALLGAALRGYCDSLVMASGDSVLRPEVMLGKLNRYLYRPGESGDMSCVVALFDTKQHHVDYAAAGQPSWLHAQALGELRPVAATGPGLGVGTNIDYLPKQMPLSEDSCHVFVSSPISAQDMCSASEVRDAMGERTEDLDQMVVKVAGVIESLEGKKPALVMLRTA